jgi:hypothetical protein
MGTNVFMSVLPTFMCDLGGTHRDRAACSDVKHLWVFVKNHCRDGCTFLMGAN